MTTPTFVDEPVVVQARFLTDGSVQPTAFIWQGRTRYIAGMGRQWPENVDGVLWRCFLVMTPTSETFELRFDPAGSRWRLYRAWLQNLA